MRNSRLFTIGLALALAAGAFVTLHGLTALAQVDSGPGLVVFASNRTGNYEIFVLDPATGLSTQLTNTATDEVEPAWSPDRSRIAFASNRDGDYELYVMRADGTGVQQLTNNMAEDRQPRWQPEGTYLIFVSNVNSGQWDLYSISVDGAIVRQLTNDPADERGPGGAAPSVISVETSGQPAGGVPGNQPVPGTPDGIVNAYRLNLRANPGEGGRIIEVLSEDTSLNILGRYYDNKWIQVQAPSGNVGWVAAWLVDISINLTSVPVVNAQYLAPPPTATATVESTVAPPPTVYISFWANKTEIKPGKCTTIGWDVEGIKEVYYNGEGVSGHQSREVCPGATTTYHLRVILVDGSTTDRYITIVVKP